MAGVAAGVVVLGAIGGLALRARTPVEPRLNDATAVLAKFVASTTFEQMPYEKQRMYYKVLDDRGKEIDQAYKVEHLTETEYRCALDAAWMGKHINRVEKYMAKSPMARTQYIDELLKKNARKDAQRATNKKPDAADQLEADEAAAEQRVDSWPPTVRAEWKQFHEAYRAEKKAHGQAATRSTAGS